MPATVPAHPDIPAGSILRHFTVAVFIVHRRQVLLHYHAKLGKWLPPGGHIEENELPDEAAVREAQEETGLAVRLVGAAGLSGVDGPLQLVVPVGVQVEDIYPGHQHIDLVYFAVLASTDGDAATIGEEFARRDRVGWYPPESLPALGASEEIQAWATRAVREVIGYERGLA